MGIFTINQEDKKMSKFKTLVKTTLTPIALCLSLAIAAPAMAKKDHHHNHDGMRQILSELSLTDTQKQDIKQILRQTREDNDLFRTDAKSLKTELRSLIQSTEWDQTAVESAITQRQSLIQEKALQRAHNKNQIWNLLTGTQQGEFVAQLESRKTKGEPMGHRDKRKDKRHNKKFARLNLTDTQLVAVQAIKAAAKASGEEIHAKLKNFKQAEQTLVQSTDFNAEAWRTLSNEYQADFLAMATLKAKTRHDIWNLLTPEQQTEAAKKGKEKMSKKGKKHQQQESK